MTALQEPDTGQQLDWDDEEDFVRVRHGGWRIARALISAVVLGGIAIVLATGVKGWFERQLDPEGEPSAERVTIIVPAGATTSGIAELLEEKEIIPNSTFFKYFAEYKDEGNFQAGEYSFQENSSAELAIEVLNRGPKPPVYERFQIREGLWTSEVLPQLAAQLDNVTLQDLERLLANNEVPARYRPDGETSWEAMFFPDTYEVNADADGLETLLKMTDEMARVTGELGYGAAETQLGYSAYEVLIVASLIEAETRSDEERPLVASVIYNRLREQWILGIDATCIYGAGDRQVELTRSVLDADTPYGCRTVRGLPPTPINSPGRASLEAAINPAETDFFYYVLTDPSGRHTFVPDDDAAWAAAKAECQDKGLC